MGHAMDQVQDNLTILNFENEGSALDKEMTGREFLEWAQLDNSEIPINDVKFELCEEVPY
jgi:hypothetical protein